MAVPDDTLKNTSVIGRLLEEISWEGASVRGYRLGGRGRENVLTAEIFLPLGYLPRRAFLGEVLRVAHGADEARAAVIRDIEPAVLTLLPDETVLPPTGIVVQPDATLVSVSTHVLVEAKRIRASSFSGGATSAGVPGPGSRRWAADAIAACRSRLATPVRLAGHAGRVALQEAVTLHLGTVYNRVDGVPLDLDEMTRRLPETLAWITWSEIQQTVACQAGRCANLDQELASTIRRLSASVTTAIDWHA